MLLKILAQQEYASLDAFVRKHRLVLPKPRETWRLVADPLIGQINGIDAIGGKTIATNGIMVALENPQGVVYGHLEWFIPSTEEVAPELSDLYETAPRKASKKLRELLATYANIEV